VLPAQIAFPDFSSVAGLALNNHAVQAGNVLRVTPPLISQRGTAFLATPMPVGQGFDTTFTFRVSALSGGGADGLAFIIQNDPRLTTALGNHASAIGYGAFVNAPAGTAIANSLVIELDTWFNSFGGYSDLSGNEISIHTNGVMDNSQSEGVSIGRVTAPGNMSDGQPHTLRIRYVPGTMDLWLDGTSLLSVPYDFITGGTHVLSGTAIGGLNLLAGGHALVGFTASTGGSWESHDIESWTFDALVNDPCLAGNIGAGVGGPYDVLTINGTGGGPVRTVFAGVGQVLTVTMNQPPTSVVPSGFILLGQVGFPATGTTFPTPFGPLCVPPAVISPQPGLFVLADTFGFGLGSFFVANPTTWTVMATVPIATRLALQPVMEESPGVIGIGNAVLLDVQ